MPSADGPTDPYAVTYINALKNRIKELEADRPQGEWLKTEERETYIDADWNADPIVPTKYRLSPLL